jgi:hypothetical protein
VSAITHCRSASLTNLSAVARIVHFLRLHVVGKRIVSASAIDDKNVFGKVGTSGAEVEAALKGKKVSLLRTTLDATTDLILLDCVVRESGKILLVS